MTTTALRSLGRALVLGLVFAGTWVLVLVGTRALDLVRVETVPVPTGELGAGALVAAAAAAALVWSARERGPL